MSLHTILTGQLYDYFLPIFTSADIPNIIFDYDNGVEQEGDFVAIDIQRIAVIGKPSVVYKPIQGSENHENEEIVSYRGTVFFAVDIYSEDETMFIGQEAQIEMERERTVEQARKLNLGLVNYEDIINLTATQEGRFRSRAQFSVAMNFVSESSKIDGTIGTVTIKGDIDEGKYLIEETITDGL